ncbi:MAG: SDR family oxidoreductase [Spirochaetes bacterium]|nr:SDR family oxidoreductase [Spirochaetota bacterium]
MAEVNLFKNKTVLITGGADGLGKALAIELALAKADVIVVDRSKDQINALINEISQMKKKCGKVTGVEGDVSSLKGCEEIIKNTKRINGSIDILINNAAALVPSKFEEQKTQDIQNMVNVNIMGTMNMTKLALPVLRSSKKPGLINISGFFGKVGVPYFSVYSATEFAITGFTESLQREFAGEPIRVMGVHTAGIKTNMFKGMIGKMTKMNFVFEAPEVVAKKIVTAYNEMKNDLVLGKNEKSLAFWNTASKNSVNNKFKKIKTKLLNAAANFGSDE